MRYAYIGPTKEEAAVSVLSMVNAMQPSLWKLCSSGERLSSQPRSCDSSPRELSSSRRLGFGEVQSQSDTSHIPQRGKTNSYASRFPMYSHNGNLTSHLHVVSCFGPFWNLPRTRVRTDFCRLLDPTCLTWDRSNLQHH
jgi:hypothetical protein